MEIKKMNLSELSDMIDKLYEQIDDPKKVDVLVFRYVDDNNKPVFEHLEAVELINLEEKVSSGYRDGRHDVSLDIVGHEVWIT
jgi:hypothetical protein